MIKTSHFNGTNVLSEPYYKLLLQGGGVGGGRARMLEAYRTVDIGSVFSNCNDVISRKSVIKSRLVDMKPHGLTHSTHSVGYSIFQC